MLRAHRVINGIVTPLFVLEGEIITDFRGDKWMFCSVMRDGNSNKIYARKPGDARSHRFFFPSVFGLEIMEDGSLKDGPLT
jgi:hypothetical protein